MGDKKMHPERVFRVKKQATPNGWDGLFLIEKALLETLKSSR